MNDNKKQTTALVLMILGCVALFVTKILPLCLGFVMSFKDIVPMKGDGPWVGMRNFTMLMMGYPTHYISFKNTIRMNFLALVMAALLTFICLWALNQVKNKKLYSLFTVMMVVPYFIPTAVLANAIGQLNTEHLGQFYFYYLLIQAVRMASLAVALSLVLVHVKGIKKVLFGIAIIALLQMMQSLSSNLDGLLLLSNPLNYDTMSTLDMFAYKMGLFNMQISVAQAGWIMKYICELVCRVIAMGIGFGLMSKIAKVSDTDTEENTGLNIMGIVVCAVISLMILGLLVKSFLPTGDEAVIPQINVVSSVIYFVMVLLTSLMVSILAATLAYPLTVKNTAIQIIYSIIIAIAAYAGTLSMHQFMLFKGVGLFNTLLAVMLSDFMPVILILGFAMAYYGMKDHSLYQGKPYSDVMMKPVIGATALVFAAKWGSYIAPLVYTAGLDKATPALNYYMAMTQMGGSVSPALTAILVIPSLLVLVGAALLIIPRKAPAH